MFRNGIGAGKNATNEDFSLHRCKPVFLFGGFALIVSKSDIQIIVAVLCFGFASLILGFAAVFGFISNAAASERTSSGRLPCPF
jgi:hypothetical protein